ncbi:MAG: GbsR/MarR family transcriptional regulator [Hyphomicrobiaceae bacterium]
MTEISASSDLPPSIERFVLHWGEMGARWGVNRSVAQIHALLFVAARPLTAEDIAETLHLARSNVSTSLRELLSWDIVKRVQVLGNRRDFYAAEGDMMEMVRRIAEGRKARELDPTIGLLRSCAAEAAGDKQVSADARARLAAMLQFTQAFDKAFDELLRLPSPTLLRLMRMGGAVAKLVAPRRHAR